MRPALPAYLRSLWNIAPALLDLAEPQALRCSVSPLGLHLPKQCPPDLPAGVPARDWWQAAAAHAAAHLVFTRQRFDPAGLGPIPRAILGALEDARVEWLACRELPGLRRLWLRFHRLESPSSLPGVEELLRRLAHALLDPSHHDPHPWVAKGRQLFFADAEGQVLALWRPEALRLAATRLGHDLGQLRLGFNARQYRVAPTYRDDHSVLWLEGVAPDGAIDTARQTLPDAAAGLPPRPSPDAAAEPVTGHHLLPEWDYKVPVLRPRWCSVREAPAPAADASAVTGLPPEVRSPSAAPRAAQTRRQREGPVFDLEGLVDAGVALRRGTAPPTTLYRRRAAAPRRLAGLLLIDSSASTSQPAPAGGSVLDLARLAAWQAAARWPHSAIAASCSDGRHAVQYLRVKEPWQAQDDECWRRLGGLRSRLSTRLGAALRHATSQLLASRAAAGHLLLITDGRPQDVDVHDPRYLAMDALHAVRAARRRGLQVQCLCLDARTLAPLQRVFGVGQVQYVGHPSALPRTLARLETTLR